MSRCVDLGEVEVLVDAVLLGRDQPLQRFHTVERRAKALPHFTRSGMRQKRSGGLAIPITRHVAGSLDRREAEAVLLEVVELGVDEWAEAKTISIQLATDDEMKCIEL